MKKRLIIVLLILILSIILIEVHNIFIMTETEDSAIEEFQVIK
jgi:hypothetical protein